MIYFLGLLLLLPIFFLKSKYFLSYYWTKSIKSGKNNYFKTKDYCFILGWILLVMASANLLFEEKSVIKQETIKKYLLLNDVSGSMLDSKENSGIGKKLGTLLQGNKYFLESLSSEKNLVGCLLFSDEALIISHFMDDPLFIYKKLMNIDYMPLGGGTAFDKGIWASVEMLIESVLPKEDLFFIKNRMYEEYKKPERADFLKEKIKGDSIIVFTDGEFENIAGLDKRIMSVVNLLKLCQDLGIRVFVISVERIDEQITVLCKNTGGSTVSLKSFNEKTLQKAYQDVIASTPKEYYYEEKTISHSFSTLLGIISLGLFFIWFVLKNTLALNYVEI